MTKLPLRDVLSVALRSFTRAPLVSVGWCLAVSAASAAFALATTVAVVGASAALFGFRERSAGVAALALVIGLLVVAAVGVGTTQAGLGWIAWELERRAVPTFGACARAIARRMPTIVRASLNVGAMCFGGLLCVYVGGLVTASVFCCALPMVACETRGAVESIDAARRLSAPHEWRVLLLYALATPFVLAVDLVGLAMVSLVSRDASWANVYPMLRALLLIAAVAPFTLGTGAVFGSVASGIYVVLRRQVEAASIEEIAKRFE